MKGFSLLMLLSASQVLGEKTIAVNLTRKEVNEIVVKHPFLGI